MHVLTPGKATNVYHNVKMQQVRHSLLCHDTWYWILPTQRCYRRGLLVGGCEMCQEGPLVPTMPRRPRVPSLNTGPILVVVSHVRQSLLYRELCFVANSSEHSSESEDNSFECVC